MLGTAVAVAADLVAALVGVALTVLVVLTIWLVARGRVSRPPRTGRETSRPVPRSMRGWQAFALREVRRAGRRR